MHFRVFVGYSSTVCSPSSCRAIKARETGRWETEVITAFYCHHYSIYYDKSPYYLGNIWTWKERLLYLLYIYIFIMGINWLGCLPFPSFTFIGDYAVEPLNLIYLSTRIQHDNYRGQNIFVIWYRHRKSTECFFQCYYHCPCPIYDIIGSGVMVIAKSDWFQIQSSFDLKK